MIGVLDKETGTMELHKTDVFHMTPYIKGMGAFMHIFQNQFLLAPHNYFITFPDALMRCRKFELIPTSNF